jgi:hypothetical protein
VASSTALPLATDSQERPSMILFVILDVRPRQVKDSMTEEEQCSCLPHHRKYLTLEF